MHQCKHWPKICGIRFFEFKSINQSGALREFNIFWITKIQCPQCLIPCLTDVHKTVDVKLYIWRQIEFRILKRQHYLKWVIWAHNLQEEAINGAGKKMKSEKRTETTSWSYRRYPKEKKQQNLPCRVTRCRKFPNFSSFFIR